MITYKCYNIVTEDSQLSHSCVISVPAANMETPEDRQEHLVAMSGELEKLVGPVESFQYELVTL